MTEPESNIPGKSARAIYAAETPVGFLMLEDDPLNEAYHLWRFMIDARFQGYGFGRRALELLIEHVKTRPERRPYPPVVSLKLAVPIPFTRSWASGTPATWTGQAN